MCHLVALAALVVLSGPAHADGTAPLTGGSHAVKTVRGIAYYEGKDADPNKHKLDLFLPEGKSKFPVLFFIHGGGWSSGDRRMYGSLGQHYAQNGVGSVVMSYRLSPLVQHPSHVQDVARAFAWTVRHIGEYGGRADQIFVTGQSAGGHLAALLGTNDKYLKAEGLSTAAIKGVIPVSGIYSFPAGRMTAVIGTKPGASDDASPLRHVSAGLPPFLILYADGDFPGCGAMSKALDAALRAKGVETALVEVENRNHLTIMFKWMVDPDDVTSQAVLAFVAKHSGMPLTPRVKAGPGGDDGAKDKTT